jgi:D-alanyl-lipoteichoic acid acyltransferase DltB (MBOAT superfamily)
VLFNSFQFALFLPILLVLYYALARRWQNTLLLVAGYIFYGAWDWRFCFLLAFSTVLDYTLGRAMGTTEDGRHRKALIVLSIVANLSFLGFFKYFNFFVDSFATLAHSMGFNPNVPLLRVVLPVGISFYTFQSLAYTIDVYRRVFPPEKNFLDYATYVSYFPQLVAGPIERAPNLLTQLKRPRVVDEECIYQGGLLMLIGFFKKLAIADAVAPHVQLAFNNAEKGSWVLLLAGIWLFTIQIYCDFSGYTDIARGVSKLMRINLMENFNQPYLSTNITEFWRRWHISLSSWLRDYLYIPLGGNRKGQLKTYRNLMITMLLGGLWHGASWTFVIWGGLHGLYLAIHKMIIGIRQPLPSVRDASDSVAVQPTVIKTERCAHAAPWTSPILFLSLLLTLHLVMLTWIFFRAPSLRAAVDYLQGIVTLRGSSAGLAESVKLVGFYIALVLLVDIPMYRRKTHVAMLEWNWVTRGAVAAGMILLIVLFAPNNETPFIYFQF